MLKKFFLNTLSSFVGAWLAMVLCAIAAVITIVALCVNVEGDSKVKGISKHSVLTLELNGVIEEAETAAAPDFQKMINGDFERPQTLDVIVRGITDAAKNKDIDALYIKCGNVSASLATLNAIREAVTQFRKEGKKVIAYGDELSGATYYVASASDSIFVNPQGMVVIKGLGSTSIYMKDLFDKVGVQFQVVKVGTFKSAVEPYIQQTMSEPARAQMDTLFTNVWGYMKDRICENRKKLTPAGIDSLINVENISYAAVNKSLTAGLVDGLVYERAMDERIAKMIGVEKKKLNFVSPEMVAGQTQWGNGYSAKNQIAVLYATGEIIDGDNQGINYEKLVPIITELADEDKVKGLVLRVNSPGGSAFGSDQIGEALDYFQSKGKPLAVSMGDYAASGGYWISCGADKIFADPLTITGSIGIFGLIPNGADLLHKLGLNPQTVRTNPGADFPSLYAPMDAKQLDVMQKYVERGYDNFVSRVAKGRKMTDAQVRRIAEGRVWDAMKAKQIGLVDSIGSLRDAIEWTSKQAKVSDKYKVSVYPVLTPGFWDIVMASSDMVQLKDAVSSGNKDMMQVWYARRIFRRGRIQALMPEMSVEL